MIERKETTNVRDSDEMIEKKQQTSEIQRHLKIHKPSGAAFLQT